MFHFPIKLITHNKNDYNNKAEDFKEKESKSAVVAPVKDLKHETKKRIPLQPKDPNIVTSNNSHTSSISLKSILKNFSIASPRKVKVNLNANQQQFNFSSKEHTEIFNNLLTKQSHQPSPSYISQQKEISKESRKILINWLYSLSIEFSLCTETLFLAVNYIDRFLSKKSIPKKRLQLLGLSSLFVAIKYEEVDQMGLNEILSVCKLFSLEDCLAMEFCLLDCLKFDLGFVSVFWFCGRFEEFVFSETKEGGMFKEVETKKFINLLHFLAELSLFCYDLLKFPYSLVAASSLLVAMDTFRVLNKSSFLEKNVLKSVTGYEFIETVDCSEVLEKFWVDERKEFWQNSSINNGNAVFKKYSKSGYNRVALMNQHRH